MSAVEQLLPSIDPTRGLQLAAEARMADGAIVTADAKPNPRLGTSADLGFVKMKGIQHACASLCF